MKRTRFLCAALAAFMFFTPASMANERIMIVLDGSGSMWGQIDGVPKLQIARDTLRDVLKTVPETTELGLLAYGHRKKGDCADIEMIVPPALGTASSIVEEADKMKFLGKTPLTAAVKQAAEELRYVEDAATVVLITDGLETCEANVCELGTLLEEQGANFTAHVVGFGLSKEEGAQVACLAENTGGKYFSADNGDALAKALQDTVVAAPPSVTLVPVDQDGNIVKTTPMQWTITAQADQEAQQQNSNGEVTVRLAPGSYQVSIDGPEVSGGATFDVAESKKSQSYEIPVELIKLEATLEAPDKAIAGSEISVIWEGPNDADDYVTVVEKDARDGAYKGYAYTADGNPAIFTLPDGLGEYEVRYMHGPTSRTIGTRPIELTEVLGTLEGPATIAAGAQFDVVWTGPNNQGDFITIVAPDAAEGSYRGYAYTADGNPAVFNAPDETGTYEVRYVNGGSSSTLVSRPIELTALSATLSVDGALKAGEEVSVIWEGPDNPGDFITVVDIGAGEGTYKDYAYTENGSPAMFSLPAEPGEYELRYVIGVSNRTLASKTISVE